MTRAADRLIICGAEGERKRPDGCWYDLARAPLEPFLVEEREGEDKVWRFRSPEAKAAPSEKAAQGDTEPKSAAPELPSWLRRPAVPETTRARTLSPAAAFANEAERFAPTGRSAVERQKALERGRIVHRLMQSLPDIPPAQRAEAIARYLARAATNFSEAERVEITRQVRTILDDNNFAEIFTPGSRAEVPIVGRLPGGEGLAVSGQVDRLSVNDRAVFIADYKTDNVVPERPDQIPPQYVAQLALYRAVLNQLYPSKIVRAALVFTKGPVLLEIRARAMDEALEAALRSELCKNST